LAYRITGISTAPFAALFGADDSALLKAGARRVIADESPGFPCRDGLDEAALGESLLLVHHAHVAVSTSPYRASGPVFIREALRQAAVLEDAWPDYLASRILSLRAYDEAGLIVDADVVDGMDGEGLARRLLARPDTAFVHAHFARRGCFAAEIRRL
jgi:hypothetical protein